MPPLSPAVSFHFALTLIARNFLNFDFSGGEQSADWIGTRDPLINRALGTTFYQLIIYNSIRRFSAICPRTSLKWNVFGSVFSCELFLFKNSVILRRMSLAWIWDQKVSNNRDKPSAAKCCGMESVVPPWTLRSQTLLVLGGKSVPAILTSSPVKFQLPNPFSPTHNEYSSRKPIQLTIFCSLEPLHTKCFAQQKLLVRQSANFQPALTGKHVRWSNFVSLTGFFTSIRISSGAHGTGINQTFTSHLGIYPKM